MFGLLLLPVFVALGRGPRAGPVQRVRVDAEEIEIDGRRIPRGRVRAATIDHGSALQRGRLHYDDGTEEVLLDGLTPDEAKAVARCL